MTPRLERDFLAADLAAVEELLATAPPEDILGRMGLEARREEIHVELAAERTEASRTEEQDVPIPGEFLAVLPEGRRFEIRRPDGTVLRGRVAEDLSLDDLRAMNAQWANKPCTAHLRVVTLTRRGRRYERDVLLRLEPAGT